MINHLFNGKTKLKVFTKLHKTTDFNAYNSDF